jgi:hypothetical protein
VDEHRIDLSSLSLAQLEALRQRVESEKRDRWQRYAANPSLFQEAATEMPTDWLGRMVGYDAWVGKWTELEPWEIEVNRIASAELERRRVAEGKPDPADGTVVVLDEDTFDELFS